MQKINKIKNLNDAQRNILQQNYSNQKTNSKDLFNSEVAYQFDNKDKFTLPLYNKIYGDIYYGKMNNKKEVVLPKTENIVEIQNTNNKVYIFNFVADAYNDFKQNMSYYETNDILDPTNMIPIEPIEGYINFEETYEESFSNLFNIFEEYIKQENYNKKIINFNSFLNIFSIFISRATPLYSFTASKFILSKDCHVHVNGLTLTLQRKGSNSRKEKQDLLNNPNFNLFNETANFHGFIVDKNEPWKMHFNIHSPRAKEYIARYEQSSDFFEDFYVKINQYDIYFLKKYLFSFYNRFVQERPQFTQTDLKSCNREIKTKLKIINREPLSQNKISSQLNSDADMTWWRFFVFTRACEMNLGFTQEEFDQLVMQSYQIYSKVDKSKALSYTESVLNSKPVPKGKIRTYKF